MSKRGANRKGADWEAKMAAFLGEQQDCGMRLDIAAVFDVTSLMLSAFMGDVEAGVLLQKLGAAIRVQKSQKSLCFICGGAASPSMAFAFLTPLDARVSAAIASPICVPCFEPQDTLYGRVMDAARIIFPSLRELPEPTHAGGRA